MPKKLIEVALPLTEINDASAYDKMPGIGPHPKNLHHWWAGLPLPCARAVLLASILDDPSDSEGFCTKSSEVQDAERERLFKLITDLFTYDTADLDRAYDAALREIRSACHDRLPAVLDPFCGGGAIPLESQRLGLESRGHDLNPVAVLVSKAKVELLKRFRGSPPVNDQSRSAFSGNGQWQGLVGVAEDLRHYGNMVLEDARRTLGDVYPPAKLPISVGRGTAPVITWLWARTVQCPNPRCTSVAPLVRSFWLSTKRGRKTWLEPQVEPQTGAISFLVRSGEGSPPDGTVNRNGATCLACRGSGTPTPISFDYIRAEGRAGRIGAVLMAMVVQHGRGRLYLPPDIHQEGVALSVVPSWAPDTDLPEKALSFRVQLYGMTSHKDLFTSRQLASLTVLSDLVSAIGSQIARDAKEAGMPDDNASLDSGGRGALAYGQMLQLLMGLTIDRLVDYNCNLSRWKPSGEQQMQLFARQAVPMVWDFSEANVLGEKGICWKKAVDISACAVNTLGIGNDASGAIYQLDAASLNLSGSKYLVSTDPPYYGNIGYADLSDLFYVWLRRSTSKLFPDICSTVLVPKQPELVANPHRFDEDISKAREHFRTGFKEAFVRLRSNMDERFPMTVYYAMKQTEDEESDEGDDTANGSATGWETLLESLIESGFQITGTWPVRASQKWRMIAMGTNALASYIVLSCRSRSDTASLTTRRDYVGLLRKELPPSLRTLQKGNIPPVDLAQAALGPGMAVYSRFSKVVETDGSPMTVRNALALINQVLDEVLAEQDSEYDSDTRWALAWFEQYAMNDGQFGDAETLSKSKNTSVQGLVDAGVLFAKAGKVRLLERDELDPKWDPTTDKRITIWEICQHLIHALDKKGEGAAATLLQKVGGLGEVARDLAYRLFTICERKGWAQEALAYNSLVVSWPQIKSLASKTPPPPSGQQPIGFSEGQ